MYSIILKCSINFYNLYKLLERKFAVQSASISSGETVQWRTLPSWDSCFHLF